MRFRFRRSHVYLLLLLIVFFVGWLIFVRLDNQLKTRMHGPRSEVLLFRPEKWSRKHAAPYDSAISYGKKNKTSENSLNFLFKKIDCVINNEYTIPCIKARDGMVHIPFNFIKKYFEIDGHLVKSADGTEYMSWEHSYSKIYRPKQPYDPRGAFLWFENYNVEVRDRVKCISGTKAVPISIQWEPKGHFYPIQIAQFGLSHFSKNLTSGKTRTLILEDGSFKYPENWKFNAKENSDTPVKSIQEPGKLDVKNDVLFINGQQIAFRFKQKKLTNYWSLSVRLIPSSNFSFTVYLQNDVGKEYSVTYVARDGDFIDGSTGYGFGRPKEGSREWISLVRDLIVDLQKAYSVHGHRLSSKPRNFHISRIIFRGQAILDDLMLSSNAHEAHFLAAVKWMVESQDRQGGWPIQAARKISSGALVLDPGWYSAMAQGQGISLLTRMYHYSGDQSYLNAAIRALALFDRNSTQSGIRTYFLEKNVWFEEYPTVPSTYVLNGFIYSLFGLYDLKMSCGKSCPRAETHFNDGINSLKSLLPLFDTGTGTLYDLRHFSLKIEPKPARWDYHTTHINQLLYLNSLLDDPQLANTTKRWIGYMKGRRASHN